MSRLPEQVLLYRSEHPYQEELKSILTSWSVKYIEFTVLSEINKTKALEQATVVLAITDESDHRAIEALRSVMHANNWIQRIMISDSHKSELFEQAINKAHINYFIGLPAEPLKLSLYLKKAWQRYQNITRPLMKFDALSNITQNLLEENESIRLQANTDALTHLLNRRSFNNMLHRFWNSYKNKELYFSLTMLDIDHFKRINDTYGHQAGDRVLQFFADILIKNQRLGIDYAFRYGGEEFVILSVSTNEQEMCKYTERLLNLVRGKTVYYQEHEINFTFSAGISTSIKAHSPEDLIDQTDRALYKAKENGRNQIVIFQETK